MKKVRVTNREAIQPQDAFWVTTQKRHNHTMRRSEIIAGLDIGTSHIRTIIGERRGDGTVAVLGFGERPTSGVCKAEVVDVEAAVECVHQSVQTAEDSADVDVRKVFVGINGPYIRSFNHHATVSVRGVGHKISVADEEAALRAAWEANLPDGDVVVHAMRGLFDVDDLSGVVDPVGMFGTELGVEAHIIHAVGNRAENFIGCIHEMSPLSVESAVFNGYAATLAVLNERQQKHGALVVDMGAGVTAFLVCVNGVVKHSGVIPTGGDHITQDGARALRIPVDTAERLKLEHGSVAFEDIMDSQAILLSDEAGVSEDTVVFRDEICTAMRLRVEETLLLIKRQLSKSGYAEQLGAGVFLTGGCANLRGIRELSQDVLELPAQIGRPQPLPGLAPSMRRPEYATPVGIVLFGAMQ
jgi:cell division protein FtsA